MPGRTTCIAYGSLSEQPYGDIDPLVLIGRSYQVESFILGAYLGSKGMWGLISTIRQCNGLMADSKFQASINKRF